MVCNHYSSGYLVLRVQSDKFIQRFNRLIDCFIDLWRLFVSLYALPSPDGLAPDERVRKRERERGRGDKSPLR